MNDSIKILVSFFITGICIGIVFDIFRITRKAFKLPNLLIYIEDILFWILTGALLLFDIYVFTDGQIRLYMILMLILGALIYFLVISKYFIKTNTKIIEIIKYITLKLLSPFKKLAKKLIKFKKIFKK